MFSKLYVPKSLIITIISAIKSNANCIPVINNNINKGHFRILAKVFQILKKQ